MQGFANPTKTDRRFFSTRLKEMFEEGIIEKLLVPSNRKNNATVVCIHLVDENGSQEEKTATLGLPADEDDDTAGTQRFFRYPLIF